MQKITIALLFMFFVSTQIFSQTPTSTPPDTSNKSTTLPTGTGISKQDEVEMREVFKNLGSAFGVTDEKEEKKTETKKEEKNSKEEVKKEPEEKSKTMPDVIDKAIDLTAKGISMIAQNVEKAAPWVWGVMLRQQYARAVSILIVPWGLLIMAIIYFKIVRKTWTTDTEAQFAFVKVIPTVCMVAFTVWGLIALSSAVKILINPEYYAIQNLLQLILRPDQL